MIDEQEFQEQMRKVRHGDDQAAAWLVQHFEPELRRVIRLRLTDRFLRRLVDSADICQSVLGNFFVRAALGQYEFAEPRNLIGLLATMAHNKVLNMVRDNRKEKLARQADTAPESIDQVAEPVGPPLDVQELLQKARRLLSVDEARLVEDRLAGKSWQEIAAARNETADKCRKQHRRALDRVAEQLGLAETV